jgi:hypothetical protein
MSVKRSLSHPALQCRLSVSRAARRSAKSEWLTYHMHRRLRASLSVMVWFVRRSAPVGDDSTWSRGHEVFRSQRCHRSVQAPAAGSSFVIGPSFNFPRMAVQMRVWGCVVCVYMRKGKYTFVPTTTGEGSVRNRADRTSRVISAKHPSGMIRVGNHLLYDLRVL